MGSTYSSRLESCEWKKDREISYTYAMETTVPQEHLRIDSNEWVVAGIRCGYVLPVPLGDCAEPLRSAFRSAERKLRRSTRSILIPDSSTPGGVIIDTSIITPEVWDIMSQIKGPVSLAGTSYQNANIFFLNPSEEFINSLPDSLTCKRTLSNMRSAYIKVALVPQTLAQLQIELHTQDEALKSGNTYYRQLRDRGDSIVSCIATIGDSQRDQFTRLQCALSNIDRINIGLPENIASLTRWMSMVQWEKACKEIMDSNSQETHHVRAALREAIGKIRTPPQPGRAVGRRERQTYTEIPPLKDEDVRNEDPLIILSRFLNDVQQGRFDLRLVTPLQDRFGDVVESDDSPNAEAIRKIIDNIQAYWPDGPPIDVDSVDMADIPPSPIRTEALQRIQSLVDPARRSIEEMRQKYPLRIAREDPAIQLRLTYTREELLEISRLLRDDPRTFRVFEGVQMLSQVETFDTLARSYLTMPPEQRRILLDLYRDPETHTIRDIDQAVDSLMRYCPEAMRPPPFNEPIHGLDMHMTTLFDIGERKYAESRPYEPQESSQEDNAVTQARLGTLSNLSDALSSVEPTFKEFPSVFGEQLSACNGDFVRALCQTRVQLERTNPGKWARMKRVAQAVLFLEDIGHARYRNERTYIDSPDEGYVELASVFPETLANRWLRMPSGRRNSVMTPRPYGSSSRPAHYSAEPGVTHLVTGVNGAGKTSALKATASPLPPICGSIQSVTFVGDLRGGVTSCGGNPRFYGESRPIAPPNASQFQAQARLMLAALTDGAMLDEIAGTTPEYKLALAVAARLMGLSHLVTHSPLDEAGCMRSVLGDEEYDRRVDGQMVDAGVTTPGRVVTLSGGAYLAGAVGCPPKYLELITDAARAQGIPLHFPPEYTFISGYYEALRRDDPEKGTFSPDSIDFLGFGPSGEISSAGAGLIAEATRNTPLDGLEFALTNSIVHLTGRFLADWLRDPDNLQRRTALIDFFLRPISKRSDEKAYTIHATHLLACTIPSYVRLHPQVEIGLLRKLKRGGTTVALGNYPAQLKEVGAFSQETHTILGQLQEYYLKMGQCASLTAQESLDADGVLAFKKDVEGLILSIIREHADTLVGLQSSDRASAEQLSTFDQEIEELSRKLAEEQKRQMNEHGERAHKVARGFLGSIDTDKRSALLAQIAQISGVVVTEASLEDALENSMLTHQPGETEYHILQRLPILGLLYLVLSSRAGTSQLRDVLGVEYVGTGQGGFKSMIDNECDKALRASNQVFNAHSEDQSPPIITQQEAADLTMRLLAILAESVRYDRQVADSGSSNLLFMHRSFVGQQTKEYVSSITQETESPELDEIKNSLQEIRARSNIIAANQRPGLSDMIKTADDIITACDQGNYNESHRLYMTIPSQNAPDVSAAIKKLSEIRESQHPVTKFLEELHPVVTTMNATPITRFINRIFSRTPQEATLTIGTCVDMLDDTAQRLDPGYRKLLELLVSRSLGVLRERVFPNITPAQWDTVTREMEELAVMLGLSSVLDLGGHVCPYTEVDGGDKLHVKEGVNLQVLVRMGDSIASQTAVSQPVASNINAASKLYQPSSISVGRGLHFISAPHGGHKTTAQNMLASAILLGLTLGVSPCTSIEAPHYKGVVMMPYRGSGPDVSAHTRFLEDLRYKIMEITSHGRVLLLTDEVGDGTSPRDARAEIQALLQLCAQRQADVIAISQDKQTVDHAKSDPTMHATILGIRSSGNQGETLAPVEGFVDPDVPAALRAMGWPEPAVDLVKSIYDAIREQRSGSVSASPTFTPLATGT